MAAEEDLAASLAAVQLSAAAAVPEWRELHPEITPSTAEEATRLAEGASYIASRGLEAFSQLKEWVAAAGGHPWIRQDRPSLPPPHCMPQRCPPARPLIYVYIF